VSPAGAAAGVATRWVRFYTRGLPHRIAADRRGELASDLWEQRAAQREEGFSNLRIALSILRRVSAGMAADQSWRVTQLVTMRGRLPAGLQPAADAGGAISGAGWLREKLHTTRCRACGQRYPRKLPNCPVCKTLKRNTDPGLPQARPLGF
jgi:hypothetical protein